MSNNPNKYIAVSYRLYVDGDNGREMVEEATAEQPFHFISGFGIALDAFEKKLIDVPKGEDYEFSLDKEEAYGDYVAERVVELDREIFSINGHFDHEHIYEDAVIPLQNEEGQRFFGRVVEISEEKVKVDLNHPLAGENLTFKGTVLENREATSKEIEHLVAHMSGGCGCGCHHDHDGECNCDSDCDCGHDHHEGCGCGHCH